MNLAKAVFVGLVFSFAISPTPIVYSGGLQPADSLRVPADSPSAPVTYFNAETVAAGFARGGALFDGNGGKKNYQVITARRDKPGEVEIHTLDTDVIYVLAGSDAIVTGGTAVNSRTTAPNELRATSIEGGETRQLVKGDVLIVPKGVPHWFKEAPASVPFLYFVVKVR